ncbi:hypothetical protein [Methylorubrum sp. SB2]|uniref:hypothetical protein n=1 Tax=Methylorubrum subtropicum TaxID=3138812 RepID=UPI00313B23B0
MSIEQRRKSNFERYAEFYSWPEKEQKKWHEELLKRIRTFPPEARMYVHHIEATTMLHLGASIFEVCYMLGKTKDWVEDIDFKRRTYEPISFHPEVSEKST